VAETLRLEVQVESLTLVEKQIDTYPGLSGLVKVVPRKAK